MSKTTTEQYQYWLKKYPDLPIDNPTATYKKILSLKKSVSYNKMLLCAIVWKVRNENANSPLLEQYRDYLQRCRTQQEIRDRNHDEDKEKVIQWEKVLEIRDSLPLGRMKLILALYTYIPTRRLRDFILMKYSIKENPDTEFNYYVSSKKFFVFNQYKTAKTFKTQKLRCPPTLQNVIEQYVEKEGIQDGDLLLGMNNYLQMYYQLKKTLGCSVDSLRHSHVSYLYKKYNLPSSKKLEKNAYEMGHSVETHMRYRKNIY